MNFILLISFVWIWFSKQQLTECLVIKHWDNIAAQTCVQLKGGHMDIRAIGVVDEDSVLVITNNWIVIELSFDGHLFPKDLTLSSSICKKWPILCESVLLDRILQHTTDPLIQFVRLNSTDYLYFIAPHQPQYSFHLNLNTNQISMSNISFQGSNSVLLSTDSKDTWYSLHNNQLYRLELNPANELIPIEKLTIQCMDCDHTIRWLNGFIFNHEFYLIDHERLYHFGTVHGESQFIPFVGLFDCVEQVEPLGKAKEDDAKENKERVIACGATVGVCFLLLTILTIWFCFFKKRKKGETGHYGH